ncbi:MAG: FAD-dependent oxidoreductase [Thermoplasmatales archaeon]
MEFSYFTRKQILDTLDGKEFDVLIIGGGITGAGVAGVLASNDLRVLLVEKGDFGSGTSSNSSKLIHGGLRYLAQGHLLLTRELLLERNYLLKNVEIVKSMNFDILIDSFSWSRLSISSGLLLYNVLGGIHQIPRFHGGKYDYDGYRGYFSYMDGLTDDALLVIYNVVSAVMNGASALNYVSVQDFRNEEEGVLVNLRDSLDGRSYSVRTNAVVNATGPWVNEVHEKYAQKKIENLRLSRGVHLILNNKRLNIQNAIAFRSHIDKRQMFLIPRGEVVIAGTTDDFTDRPWDDHIEDKEREYIFSSVSRIIRELKKDDVVGEYVGVRPLYGSGNDPGRVTRDFHLVREKRMISVMGVKITNYRNASRKVAAKVGDVIGLKIKTSGLPVISYRRNCADAIECAIKQECAITTEDVIRRRIGAFYFTVDRGRSLEETVNKKIMEFRTRK